MASRGHTKAPAGRLAATPLRLRSGPVRIGPGPASRRPPPPIRPRPRYSRRLRGGSARSAGTTLRRPPPTRAGFESGLREGSDGGHGPVRYQVVEHQPGRLVRFRFTAPPGLLGEHRYELEDSDGTVL